MRHPTLPQPEEREIHSLSPEARRREAQTLRGEVARRVGPGTRAFEVVKRTVVGSFNDGVILAAVMLLMLSLLAQVVIGAAQQVIEAYFPQLMDRMVDLQLSRILPALGLFGSLYMLFYSLTPSRYRHRRYPKWPGVLFTTLWWILVTTWLPVVLRSFFTYNLTYGSLAGIMIALFFFWLVGLGVVIGAELNAALAETPEEEINKVGQEDDRRRDAERKQTEEKDAT